MYICIHLQQFLVVKQSICTNNTIPILYIAANGQEEDELLRQHELLNDRKHRNQVQVKHYVGEKAITFFTDYGPAGVYTLNINAIEDDTSVRIYATTTPYSDYPYPELPPDSAVRLVHVGKTSVSLAWKQSYTAQIFGREIVYCLMVNRVRNLATMCGAQAFMYGETPPTAPPNSGFGFAWEQGEDVSFQSKLYPSDTEYPRDLIYKCIGPKTSYTFHGLKQGQKYHFDVFAVSPSKNRSTAYQGVSATTKLKVKQVKIKEDKLIKTYIKRTVARKIFEFQHPKSTKQLIISVLPCYGRLDIAIFKDGELLINHTTKELHIFTISRAKKGKYIIDISTRQFRSCSLQLHVTSKSKRFPYPELPEDQRIKVFQNRKSCDTVTIAWLATKKKVQYCLYMKAIPNGPSSKFGIYRHTENNNCVKPSYRKKSEKVMCKAVRYKSKRRTVITEVVRGLKPNINYTFDVYASLPGSHGQTLSYKSTSILISGEKC